MSSFQTHRITNFIISMPTKSIYEFNMSWFWDYFYDHYVFDLLKLKDIFKQQTVVQVV